MKRATSRARAWLVAGACATMVPLPVAAGTFATAGAFAGAVTLVATAAEARPGGGSSFSGGSHSSSSFSSGHSSSSSSSSHGFSSSSGSSSGSGGGELAFDLLLWCFAGGIGRIGIVGTIMMVVVLGLVLKARAAGFNLTVGAAERAPQTVSTRRRLEALRETDANFSVVLLEDFLQALYIEAATRRPAGGLERLSAFLRPAARNALVPREPIAEVRSVIVGAMRLADVSGLEGSSPEVAITVEYETNYTEVGPAGEKSYYAAERWILCRNRQALSRTPDRTRVFLCPSCGAPLDATIGGKCSYCHNVLDTGQYDWVVDSIQVVSREERGPMLTGTTAEKGTDLSTIFDPDVQARFAALTARDPAVTWQGLVPRLTLIFNQMQTSWSTRDWKSVRPFVSDNLFQSLGYWIDAYQKQRLRNITENARILDIQLTRVTADRFYDAVTVRLFASSLDYTLRDADGQVVGGSRSRERKYSEYWTLIRGSQRSGPPRVDLGCPNCGAPLANIEMAGTCGYCRARVTTGDFDWVLSRIEQDDVYEG